MSRTVGQPLAQVTFTEQAIKKLLLDYKLLARSNLAVCISLSQREFTMLVKSLKSAGAVKSVLYQATQLKFPCTKVVISVMADALTPSLPAPPQGTSGYCLNRPKTFNVCPAVLAR